MASSEFRPLDEKSLIEYIKATPRLLDLLGEKLEALTVEEVGDGNLNFVYIVVSATGSVVIKQVIHLMPTSRKSFDFSMHLLIYCLTMINSPAFILFLILDCIITPTWGLYGAFKSGPDVERRVLFAHLLCIWDCILITGTHFEVPTVSAKIDSDSLVWM